MSAPFGLNEKVTFLAPMQDITDRGFIEILCGRGAPDFCIAEYFRIHEYFELSPHILDTILNSPPETCVAAQFIGENVEHIKRAIEALKFYPQVRMLDLNLGCPAPKIYRKNVGGGLLRDVQKIMEIAKAIRQHWDGVFSVKMRIGFESSDDFGELLDAVCSASPDFITIHARTVKQLYRGKPDYGAVAYAVGRAGVPIIANGDISSAEKAMEVFKSTGCAGVMCGRHAVRNPWIFRQIKELASGREIYRPKLCDVREYIDDLLRNCLTLKDSIKHIDSRLKKFINFIATGVDERGEFLYHMRRARGLDDLLKVCDRYLLEGGNSDKPFALDAYPNLCSRPNHEDFPK